MLLDMVINPHLFLILQNGKTLSFIDNWETMYQDSERRWVSEAAKEKHVSREFN